MKAKKLNRKKKLLLGVCIAFLVYSIVGFFIIPLLLKNALVSKLTQGLNRQAVIEKVTFNPYTFAATVNNFSLLDRSGSELFIIFERFSFNLEAISLIKRALVIKSLVLDKPDLKIIRNDDETFNFSDIFSEKTQSTETNSKPFLFSFNNIEVIDGRLEIDDQFKKIAHSITKINFALPTVSNLAYNLAEYIEPSFSAAINGTQVTLDGRAKPFSKELETECTIHIKHFEIPKYIRYIPGEGSYSLSEGFLDIDGTLYFSIDQQARPGLGFKGAVNLQNLNVVDQENSNFLHVQSLESSIKKTDLILENRGNPWLTVTGLEAKLSDFSLVDRTSGLDMAVVQGLQISETNIDTARQVVQIGNLVVENGSIRAVRNRNGEVNLGTIFNKREAAEKGDTTPPESAGKQKNWQVTLKKGEVVNQTVSIFDSLPIKDVTTTIVLRNLSMEDLSTVEESRGSLSADITVNDTGQISIQGKIGITPLVADLDLDIKGLAIKPLQGYLRERANMLVSSGDLATHGKLFLSKLPGQDVVVRYQGSAAFHDFTSLDPLLGETFVSWKSLEIADLDARTYPDSVTIREISWQEPFINLVVNSEGNLNLASVLIEDPETDKDESIIEQKTEEKSVQIGSVLFEGGRLEFADRSISPNYASGWQDIHGGITGLTSKESQFAEVKLEGNLSQHTPLAIHGKINPLQDDFFADLAIETKNIELSPLTPYFGKYIGHKVDKGKLSLDLNYLVEKRKLRAKNSIFFDQFNLGETVESPEAVNLPINLAISLLQNRKGEITINLPVQGDLDDPAFSFGGIVFKALFNLIAKAATSPFSLLGALIPEGVELHQIFFAAGSAELDGAPQEKLSTLANVLFDRPGLKLDIISHPAPDRDREELGNMQFLKLLKVEKLKATSQKESDARTLDSLTIEPEEVATYLLKAFEAAELEKPADFSKMEQQQKNTLLEKLLRDSVQIADDGLRLLAIRRTNAVKDFLVKNGPVEPERIFLIEPQTVALVEGKNAGDPRVELVIK